MSWLTDLLREYPALSVAQERLALREDQFVALEKEHTELKRKFEAQKEKVRSLERNIEELRAKLADFETQRVNIEDVERNILAFLGTQRDPVSVEQVAEEVGQNVQRVEFYLQHLLDHEFVIDSYLMDDHLFELDHKGRGFLIENGLI